MSAGYTKTPREYLPKYVEIFNVIDPNCEFAKTENWGRGPSIRIITSEVWVEIWTSPENPEHWEWYINPNRSDSFSRPFQDSGPRIPVFAFQVFRDFGLIPPKST